MVTYKLIAGNKSDRCKKVCNTSAFLKTKSVFILLIISIITVSQTFAQLAALQKVPATAAPGSSFIVQLNINRGPINGFMKFSQSLPEGYTAVEMDSKSGDFRYENNETKIIWLKAPVEVTYTVTYKIKIPKDASGTVSLTGKIIYVTNSNERKVFDFPEKKITITNVAKKVSSEINKKAEDENAVPKSKNKQTTEKKESIAQEPTPKNLDTKTPKAEIPIASSKKVYGFRKGGLEPNSLDENENTTYKPEKKFKVQIGAFRLRPKIKNVPNHSTIVVNDVTKHFSGNFSTYEEAAQWKTKMIEQGFKGAFIVEFPFSSSNNSIAQTHICNTWWHCIKTNVAKN